MEEKLLCARCRYEFIAAHELRDEKKLRCPRCGSYDLAPMARRITHRKEDGLVFVPGLLKRLITPRIPVQEIAQTLKHESNNLYEMGEGTLYPALKRLEQKGLLTSCWGDTQGGGRRKYYRITDAGKNELERKISEWNVVSNLIVKCTEGFAWTRLQPTWIQL